MVRRERDGRASARLIAIANALEGMSRAEAARFAGMERQALRDAVVRYNAEGLSYQIHQFLTLPRKSGHRVRRREARLAPG